MTILIISIIGILGVLLGKYFFKMWFNHISLYSVVWMILLLTYEIRLIRYIELSFLTWWVVIVAYVTFVLGSITIVLARKTFINQDKSNLNSVKLDILAGGSLLIKYLIIFCSIVGFLAAVQHWYVLINKFGGIIEVLIQANLIYKMRVEGEIPGVIPYIHSLSYVGVFLSGIYVAHKRKITLISILPFISVIIKEVANFGRAGILIALLIFISSFFLYKNSFPPLKPSKSKKNRLITAISIGLLLALIITSAGLIRSTRGVYESFRATTPELKKLQSGFFITPSLYLYMSSHIGVLEQYLKYEYDEKIKYGEITFQPIFNLLSKFGVVEHPGFYGKGYFIPMWSNTATYLRYVFYDFGILGLILFPYFLGLFSSYLWMKFINNKKTIYLAILSYLYVLIIFSPVTIASRLGIWFISLAMLLIFIPFLRRSNTMLVTQLSGKR